MAKKKPRLAEGLVGAKSGVSYDRRLSKKQLAEIDETVAYYASLPSEKRPAVKSFARHVLRDFGVAGTIDGLAEFIKGRGWPNE